MYLNVPVSVDTTEKFGLQVHVIEVVDNFFPVGLRQSKYKLVLCANGEGISYSESTFDTARTACAD